MTAVDVLVGLDAAGVRVRLSGGRLQAAGLVPEELARAARVQRGGLVALLRRRRLDEIVASVRRLSAATRDVDVGNAATLAAGDRWRAAALAYHSGETTDASELLAAERAAKAAWSARKAGRP